MKFLVNLVQLKDFISKTLDQIYPEDALLIMIQLSPHKKLLKNLRVILLLETVKCNLISLEIKTIRIQELEDKQELFTLEILTGDLKNGNSKIYSQNVDKLIELLFHRVKMVEAEDLVLFNLKKLNLLKEHLKSKVKKLKVELSELEKLRQQRVMTEEINKMMMNTEILKNKLKKHTQFLNNNKIKDSYFQK